MSDGDGAGGDLTGFLAAVPLLEGQGHEDLAELARGMRLRTLRQGEVVWRQGETAGEMLFVVEGSLSVWLRAAGDRDVEIWRGGPGETLGELALLDGGPHSATVTVAKTATVLALSRVDLVAILARRHPSAFALKRRLTELLAGRLRNQVRHLAASLGDAAAGPRPEDAASDLDYCSPPSSRYLRRMATFHDFDPLAVWGFLTSGRYARCPPGRMLLAEGSPSTACFLTINGAVEKAVVRGDRRIRIGLAGPGKAFGYEGLLDGLPSPVTVITRERALLLVVPAAPFGQLLRGEDAISRVVLDVMLRDLVATLRQTLQPIARQVGSRPA